MVFLLFCMEDSSFRKPPRH